MKRLFYIGVIAAAALSFTNCQKEIITDNSKEESIVALTPFTVYATTAETKTAMNEDMSLIWSEGDKINVFHHNGVNYVDDGEFQISDLENGEFEGTIDATKLAESNDWYFFYPYKSQRVTPAKDENVYTSIGQKTMTQTGNNSMSHLAGFNVPMYGKISAVAGDAMPKVQMNHIASVVRINVTNSVDDPLTVKTVTMAADEYLCGGFYVDITGDKVVADEENDTYTYKIAKLSVENGAAIAKNSSAAFYLVINPFVAAASSELTFSVNGYEKTITLPGDVSFTSGKIKTINFNYDKEPEPDYVTLPWSWEGGTSSEFKSITGVTASGLGSDYAASNAPYRVKFDSTGDNFVIKTDSSIGAISVGVKMIGGNSQSSIAVSGSADGQNYSDIQTLTISGAQNDVLTLTTTEGFDSTYRYVKVTFNKGSNVGIGPISITKATDEPIKCSTPVISYANPTVSISCATSGASIYYTLDGTDPTSTSTAYTAPFDINASATVKAIAMKEGFSNSEIASYTCTYTVPFATISCDETLSVENSESDGTISVTYQYVENYEINVYEDAEHTSAAGADFWFDADFVDVENSDYNVYWIAEANDGPERKAYIVISVMNSNTDITEKEIVVTQAKVSGGEEHTITLSCTNWTNTSYNAEELTFSVGDVSFGYINAMKNGANGTPTGWAKNQVIQTKSGGYIYNKTSLGQITSIKFSIVANTNSFTLNYGNTNECTESISSSNATSVTESVTYNKYENKTVTENQTTTATTYEFDLSEESASYFKFACGSNSIYIYKIEIVYVN